MKVIEVVHEFYAGNDAKCGNLKTERHDDVLYLVHFDTDIAYRKDGKVFINSVYYSRTTSKFTQELRRLCNNEFEEYSGTPSYNVHYYEMGEKR